MRRSDCDCRQAIFVMYVCLYACMYVCMYLCMTTCAQVYVAWLEGGTAVFAFRGTESAQDAKADIDARSTSVDWMTADYPSVRGHMGAPPPPHECAHPAHSLRTAPAPSWFSACIPPRHITPQASLWRAHLQCHAAAAAPTTPTNTLRNTHACRDTTGRPTGQTSVRDAHACESVGGSAGPSQRAAMTAVHEPRAVQAS